jgi:hypothetical protein
MKDLVLKTFKTYIKNPAIIFLFIIQYAIFSLFAFNKYLRFNSLVFEYAFLIIFALIFLLVNALCLSIIIGASYLSVKGKLKIRHSLKFSKKVWGNLFLLFILIASWAIIFGLANVIGNVVLTWFSIEVADLFFKGIILLGLLFLMLFTFQNFYYTIEDEKIIQSIKKSFCAAKKHYLKLVLIFLAFIFVDFLVSHITFTTFSLSSIAINSAIIQDALRFLLVYPLFLMALTVLFERCMK